MSVAFLTAVIAAPATRSALIAFYAGRERLERVSDPSSFNFGDPITEIDALLPGLDPDIEITDEDGLPLLAYARQAGAAIIDRLDQALTASQDVNVISVAGYDLYLAGGLSYGDDPSDAAEPTRGRGAFTCTPTAVERNWSVTPARSAHGDARCGVRRRRACGSTRRTCSPSPVRTWAATVLLRCNEDCTSARISWCGWRHAKYALRMQVP